MLSTKQILLEFKKKLTLQRYATSSIKSYTNALAKFLIVFEGSPLENRFFCVTYFYSTIFIFCIKNSYLLN